MLDGRPLIDLHLHPAPLPGLKVPWSVWMQDFDRAGVRALYDDEGAVRADAFDAMVAAEGVDVALVLPGCSPKVTGWQTADDRAALAAHNSDRIKFAANLNPHVHYPIDDELERQLALGASALKVHPVHGGFAVNDRTLYLAYEICQAAGIALVVHCGTSSFPGASNKNGDPILLSNQHVWIELSGLPPSRLKTYYACHSWARLTRRMIFGTDWPGIPGSANNARAVAEICCDETADLVLAGNAAPVYKLIALS